ncbi:MAG: histidine phosphatase family protein [Candidatus Aenigmatarchaeota archaeon]|nr:histidine phosphatase family protein [Candidatus Aenigmarchaeota archaeon]
MRILLIRHGQTDANKKNIIQGWLDFKLNESGIKQAKLLANRLKKEKIDVFYTSDLKRAVMTTEEIIKYHPGKKWFKTELLRERKFGIYEGLIMEKYKKIIEYYGLKNYEFKPPFGESYSDVKKRADLFFKEILRRHKDQTVAVISHAAFNRIFIGHIMGLNFEDIQQIGQENTCVNIIELKSKPRLISLNDYSHLNGYVF